jgi:hypothetical protein
MAEAKDYITLEAVVMEALAEVANRAMAKYGIQLHSATFSWKDNMVDDIGVGLTMQPAGGPEDHCA